MNDLEQIRRLAAYDRRVFERFERAIQRRGWKEAVRDRGTGHGSLKNTLVHILNVREAWLVAIAQDRWEIFDRKDRRPDEVRSWADLRRYRATVWTGVDRLLGTLTEAKLRRRVRAPWMPGIYDLQDAFYQASFEQAHHLGEIIGAFWQRDWRPPDMTWIENQGSRRRRR